jgi:small conductance mechanosensitive channel
MKLLQLSSDNVTTSIYVFFESVVPAILFAIVAYWVGKWLKKVINKAVEGILVKREVEPSLAIFLQSFVNFMLTVVLFIIVISILGVPTTSFVAILGAAGLAVGLALQGSLSNFAGGVLILAFKPFKIGDFIDNGNNAGTVVKIDILHTTLKTPDNKIIIVPNGGLANGSITNFSREATRRVDFSVGIAYGADIKKAREVILSVLNKDERILKDPEPVVKLLNLGDSSLDLSARAWVNAADFWNVYFEDLEAIKEALDQANISIPFPQRDVHIISQK